LIDYFSPAKVIHLNEDRYCLVAAKEKYVIGTAAIEGDHIVTFFVHPGHQRKRSGHALMSFVR
jgi:hypothetical protein